MPHHCKNDLVRSDPSRRAVGSQKGCCTKTHCYESLLPPTGAPTPSHVGGYWGGRNKGEGLGKGGGGGWRRGMGRIKVGGWWGGGGGRGEVRREEGGEGGGGRGRG